jgi:hypothetical protein
MIERASWARFLFAFAPLLAYSAWAFRPNGEFMRAQGAAAPLPETLFGFPQGQPFESFSKLGDAAPDYILFQAIDIPYAILNTLSMLAIMALGARRFGKPKSSLRFLLALPLVYLISESVENPLLAMLAGSGSELAALAPLQQLATTVKWLASAPSVVVSLALIPILLALTIRDRMKKAPRS